MMELLISKICNEISITESEQELIKSYFKISTVTKRELLLAQGANLRHHYFVESGMLRAYLKGDGGLEHILQFSAEGAWVSDNFQQIADATSLYTIQAIEDSQVLFIDREDMQELFEKVPSFNRYIRIAMQQRLSHFHWRIIIHLASFAEDRYGMFLHCYPDIVQRVPLYMIASYLGLKPETLSRNRRKIATKNKKDKSNIHILNKIVAGYQLQKE